MVSDRRARGLEQERHAGGEHEHGGDPSRGEALPGGHQHEHTGDDVGGRRRQQRPPDPGGRQEREASQRAPGDRSHEVRRVGATDRVRDALRLSGGHELRDQRKRNPHQHRRRQHRRQAEHDVQREVGHRLELEALERPEVHGRKGPHPHDREHGGDGDPELAQGDGPGRVLEPIADPRPNPSPQGQTGHERGEHARDGIDGGAEDELEIAGPDDLVGERGGPGEPVGDEDQPLSREAAPGLAHPGHRSASAAPALAGQTVSDPSPSSRYQ